MSKIGKSKPKKSKKLFKDKNIIIILNKDNDSIEFRFKKYISSEGFKKELDQRKLLKIPSPLGEEASRGGQ